MKQSAGTIASLTAQNPPQMSENLGMAASLRLHWPEYLMEVVEMILYMSCTCAFVTLFQHPSSPVRHLLWS